MILQCLSVTVWIGESVGVLHTYPGISSPEPSFKISTSSVRDSIYQSIFC